MIQLSEKLFQKCREHQMMYGTMGEEFNEYHAYLAQIDIDSRNKSNFVVVEDHGLQDSGWCDGIKLRTIVVAVKEDVLGWKCRTLRWHTSGAWFREGHGWSRYLEMTETTRTLSLVVGED